LRLTARTYISISMDLHRSVFHAYNNELPAFGVLLLPPKRLRVGLVFVVLPKLKAMTQDIRSVLWILL
jgi:hypothetical protein